MVFGWERWGSGIRLGEVGQFEGWFTRVRKKYLMVIK
jgi:hypothetical protein